MKKIVFNVELILNNDAPSEVDYPKEVFEQMISDCILYESSRDEITTVNTTMTEFEGITFKEK